MMPRPFQQGCSLASQAPPCTVRGSYSSLMHNSAFVLDKFHTFPLLSAPSSSLTLSEWQPCPPAFRPDPVFSSKAAIRLFKHDLSLVNLCSLFPNTPSSSVHLFHVNCPYWCLLLMYKNTWGFLAKSQFHQVTHASCHLTSVSCTLLCESAFFTQHISWRNKSFLISKQKNTKQRC